MNPTSIVKLVTNLENKNYTDVVLELVDQSTIIEIAAHKIILASNSDFFDTMFKFNKKTIHKLKVCDAKCAVDIIKSFYGIKFDGNYSHTLNMMKCRHQWMLPIDIKLLYQIKVPHTDYDLLLDVVSMLDTDLLTDRHLSEALRMNLPPKYDTSSLPIELVTEWNKYRHTIIVRTNTTIKFIGAYLMNTIFELETRAYSPKMTLSPDRQFVVWNNNSECKLIHLNTMQIDDFHIRMAADEIVISPNNKYFISRAYYGWDLSIRLYDVISKNEIWSIYTDSSMCFTSDSTKIIIYQNCNRVIRIVDVETGKILKEYPYPDVNVKYMVLDSMIPNPKFPNKFACILKSNPNNTCGTLFEFEFDIEINANIICGLGHLCKNKIAYSPDGKSIAFISHGLSIWNTSNVITFTTQKFIGKSICSLLFGPDNNTILVNTGRQCYILDVISRESNRILKLQSGIDKIVNFY